MTNCQRFTCDPNPATAGQLVTICYDTQACGSEVPDLAEFELEIQPGGTVTTIPLPASAPDGKQCVTWTVPAGIVTFTCHDPKGGSEDLTVPVV